MSSVNKRLRIAGIALAILASILMINFSSGPPPLPQPASLNPENQSVNVIATNLDKPWAIEFADERIFITEKIGRLRVVENNKLLEEPVITLRTAETFDGGLLGVAAHPDFTNNHALYLYYTYEDDEKLWNKIIKVIESENKMTSVSTIFDGIPGSEFGNGGVLKFGPDGKLYATTGSLSDSSHDSQDLNLLEGKILRLNDDGTIPDDNPFSNSPIFSYGHRNPKGMDWDIRGNFFVAEQGPTKNDEINLIEAGKNYGWPNQECIGESQYVDAAKCFDPEIEPGGMKFYSGNALGISDMMVLAALRGTALYAFEVDDGSNVRSHSTILSGMGRIRDVNQGPDGFLYVITSNTDGKGFPEKDDDKLLRIVK